jgi:hypothetical protein
MSMPGSALHAAGRDKAAIQKPLVGSPAEYFTAFLEAVPGATSEIRMLGTGQPAESQPASAALSRHPIARGASKDDRPIVDLSSPPVAAVPLAAIVPGQANVTPVMATVPQASGGADKSCENTERLAGTNIQETAILADPSPPASTSAANACLTEQVAGLIDGKNKSAPVASSSGDGTDNAPDLPPTNAPAPMATQPPPQLVATAPPAPGSYSEKPTMREAAVATIGSTDNTASQLISTTPNLEAKQPAPFEATPSPVSPATASAGSAMAEANRAVALRVSRAIRSGQDTLTIELHPAELGHVAVRIAFHGNGVDVRMVVSRQETFQAFTQDRAALEQQFSQAGIDLGAGGLDLRYSRTPPPEAWSAYPSRPTREDGELNERESRAIILGDNLVNIVA